MTVFLINKIGGSIVTSGKILCMYQALTLVWVNFTFWWKLMKSLICDDFSKENKLQLY